MSISEGDASWPRQESRGRRARALASVLTTLVAGTASALVFDQVASPARPVFVLVGLVLCTGWAVTGWLPLPDEAAYVGAVTFAIGVAIPIVVSVLLVRAHYWHPLGIAGALLVAAAAIDGALAVRYLLHGSARDGTTGVEN